jgi:hypothetical protein
MGLSFSYSVLGVKPGVRREACSGGGEGVLIVLAGWMKIFSGIDDEQILQAANTPFVHGADHGV